MIGLVLSQLLLFAIAATMGFAAGWFLRAQTSGLALGSVERDVETLRTALNEARVRRSRAP